MVRNRGQSTAEVAVLVAVVIGALLAMQIYIKRAAMGKLRAASDQMGDQFNPHVTTSNYTNWYSVRKNDVMRNDGSSTSTTTEPENQGRSGEEHVTDRLDTEKLFN